MENADKSPADRLEQALRDLEARKKAAADMAANMAPELERLAALQEELAALPQGERRQVLDVMGLKHVSAAPKPITPLRGSSYTQPSRPPASPRIDWRYWRHIPELKQWEACALSLNINPDNMKHNPQGWMAGAGGGPVFLAVSFPSVNVQLEFDKRVRLLGASLFKSPHFTAVNNLVRGGRHLATVSLKEFAAWALHVELEGMPPELLETAETKAASNLIPEPQAAPVVTESDAKPWLKADPRDPAPDQHWYTPARYFARQLIASDSTLLIKRTVLADKVSKSLASAGIYKRGGAKPHDATTVLKAFVKVQLG